MDKKNNLSRREFMRLLMAGGVTAVAGGTLVSLSGCSPEEAETVSAATQAAVTSEATVAATSAVTEATAEATAEQATSEATVSDAAVEATSQPVTSSGADMVIAHGSSPTAIVEAAIAALGGIEAFVSPGDDVIIKPNIVAADYSYEYAAYTNPEVVAAVTALCVNAGAGRVRVMDSPSTSTCEQVYAGSGIGDAVEAAGGEMEVMSSIKYRTVDIPLGRDITSWSFYGDVLDADVFINVPIAKHHRLAKLTLSMKNLMGVIEDRGKFHSNLGQRIADITSVIQPTLTILDAVNILMDNGPRGGNLSDVKQMNTVIAGTDYVAVGSYGATLFGQTGADVDALRCASEMGLGTLDYSSLNIAEVEV